MPSGHFGLLQQRFAMSRTLLLPGQLSYNMIVESERGTLVLDDQPYEH
jgi:hypothetical protein